MARRRELKGVANAILGSFMSRNNDVDGFWGIGQLHRHAATQGAASVEIDLLSDRISPDGAVFAPMIAEFKQMLSQQCEAHALPTAWLQGARIVVSLDAGPPVGNGLDAQDGSELTCSVVLEDDLSKMRRASALVRSWPTNPAREGRRICDSWNVRRLAPLARDTLIG